MAPANDVNARPPTERETALMTRLFAYSPELLAQAASAQVEPNCACGCGSFTVHVDPLLPPATAALEHGMWEHSLWNEERGIEVMFWTRGGFISGVEITYFMPEHPPEGVPEVAGFRVA